MNPMNADERCSGNNAGGGLIKICKQNSCPERREGEEKNK